MAETTRGQNTPSPVTGRQPFFSVFAALAALVALGFWGHINPTVFAGLPLDLFRYRAMAEAAPGLAAGIPRPFAFRILGPWLTGVMPFSTDVVFAVLTAILSVLTAVLFVRFLTRRGVGGTAVWLMLAAFLLNRYGFGFTAWNCFQVNDLFAIAVILLLFEALERGQWVVFAGVFALGILARETPILMLPVSVVFLATRRADTREWLRFMAAALPGCVLLAAVRFLIPAAGGNTLLAAAAVYAPKFFSPQTWAALLVAPFIPFALAPVIFPARTAAFVRAQPHMAVYFLLVTLSAAFGHDNQRLMAPALPVVLLFVGGLFDTPVSSRVLTALGAVAVFLAALHHTAGLFTLPSRDATVMISSAAIVLGTVVLLGLRRRLSRRIKSLSD